jgi:hypothetical protein
MIPTRWRISRNRAVPYPRSGLSCGNAWRIEIADQGSDGGWETVAWRPSQKRALIYVAAQRAAVSGRWMS